MKRFACFFAAIAAVSAFATPSSAQLVVDRMSVDLRPDSPGREDLVLKNEGTERYYVSLLASEILEAGTEREQRVDIADPEALGLLISPTRLILEPGASRAIRIVNIAETGDTDRVYRLRITPQVSDVDAPAAVDGETGVSIRVLLAYDILVVARPTGAVTRISALSEPGAVVLRNDGNTNALLLDGEICSRITLSGDQGLCKPLDDHRLYAREAWRIETDVPSPILRFRSRALAEAEDKNLEVIPTS